MSAPNQSHKIFDGSQIYAQIMDMYRSYMDNPYAMSRIAYYVNDFLPRQISSEVLKFAEKKQKLHEICEEQSNFYRMFLQTNAYYYLPKANIFFEYTNNTYTPISEDEIHLNVLHEIDLDDILSAHKQKTKQLIIKQIKTRNIFNSTPDSRTIQKVIRVFNNDLFETKNGTKHFLTVLGDRILGKKDVNGNIYFVSSQLKNVISTLDRWLPFGISYNSGHNIVTKYHELHDLSTYRCLEYKHDITDLTVRLIEPELYKLCADIMCVSVHYSNRYGNADKLLGTFDELGDRVLYFTYHQKSDILNAFVEHSITVSETPHASISWNNMFYLWKHYLHSNNIPCVFYAKEFREFMESNAYFSSTANVFVGVTSKYLPLMQRFLSFWDTHMTVDGAYHLGYEIDEIMWVLNTRYIRPGQHVFKRKDVLDIIINFLADSDDAEQFDSGDENEDIKRNENVGKVGVVDGKYLIGVRCDLWDKSISIAASVSKYYADVYDPEQMATSMDALYTYYVDYLTTATKKEMACSKEYFCDYMRRTIDADKISGNVIRGQL